MKKELRAFVIISLIILILLFFNDKYNKSLEESNRSNYTKQVENNDTKDVNENNKEQTKEGNKKQEDKAKTNETVKEENVKVEDKQEETKEEEEPKVEDPKAPTVEPKIVEVKDILLDKNEISMYTNDVVKINYSISPSNASNKNVTFKSSDESIVKVDNNGNITGITTGAYKDGYASAKITITSSNNISKTVNVKLYSRERIHFISHGESSGTDHITGDAILLESNGHYAMIDGGNTDVSKRITNYLKKIGVSKLDFILFTHMDSDHAGNFQSILESDITVSNVWMKNYEMSPYTDGYKPNYDSNGHDKGLGSQSSKPNKALARYRRILYLSKYSQYEYLVGNIKNISSNNEGYVYEFKYLNFKMTLYNNKSNSNAVSSENYNSVVSLIDVNNHKVLLTGDIYGTGDLNLISTKVGKIGILKLPHHGSRACALLDKDTVSTSLSSLKPKYIVVTSSKKKLNNIRKEYNVANGDLCIDKVSSYDSDKVFYVDETNDALVIDLTNSSLKFNKN